MDNHIFKLWNGFLTDVSGVSLSCIHHLSLHNGTIPVANIYCTSYAVHGKHGGVPFWHSGVQKQFVENKYFFSLLTETATHSLTTHTESFTHKHKSQNCPCVLQQSNSKDKLIKLYINKTVSVSSSYHIRNIRKMSVIIPFPSNKSWGAELLNNFSILNSKMTPPQKKKNQNRNLNKTSANNLKPPNSTKRKASTVKPYSHMHSSPPYSVSQGQQF